VKCDELSASVLEGGDVAIPGRNPSRIDGIGELNVSDAIIIERMVRVVVDGEPCPILQKCRYLAGSRSRDDDSPV
jgi:hypothetical protein